MDGPKLKWGAQTSYSLFEKSRVEGRVTTLNLDLGHLLEVSYLC